jgi:hypothetical protein
LWKQPPAKHTAELVQGNGSPDGSLEELFAVELAPLAPLGQHQKVLDTLERAIEISHEEATQP